MNGITCVKNVGAWEMTNNNKIMLSSLIMNKQVRKRSVLSQKKHLENFFFVILLETKFECAANI